MVGNARAVLEYLEQQVLVGRIDYGTQGAIGRKSARGIGDDGIAIVMTTRIVSAGPHGIYLVELGLIGTGYP